MMGSSVWNASQLTRHNRIPVSVQNIDDERVVSKLKPIGWPRHPLNRNIGNQAVGSGDILLDVARKLKAHSVAFASVLLHLLCRLLYAGEDAFGYMVHLFSPLSSA